ncbi:hypothetical protein [Roseospira goensis]|uniref:Uncharacterized protein n=1 Tax=Roseospira goensis TaxID=391922 RepID=A0A7W6S2C4_9PROT|nr:hypothetical protein [Roseospira goensis]MBB4287613.1 hypothetical protein [Roseospira goensis]
MPVTPREIQDRYKQLTQQHTTAGGVNWDAVDSQFAREAARHGVSASQLGSAFGQTAQDVAAKAERHGTTLDTGGAGDAPPRGASYTPGEIKAYADQAIQSHTPTGGAPDYDAAYRDVYTRAQQDGVTADQLADAGVGSREGILSWVAAQGLDPLSDGTVPDTVPDTPDPNLVTFDGPRLSRIDRATWQKGPSSLANQIDTIRQDVLYGRTTPEQARALVERLRQNVARSFDFAGGAINTIPEDVDAYLRRQHLDFDAIHGLGAEIGDGSKYITGPGGVDTFSEYPWQTLEEMRQALGVDTRTALEMWGVPPSRLDIPRLNYAAIAAADSPYAAIRAGRNALFGADGTEGEWSLVPEQAGKRTYWRVYAPDGRMAGTVGITSNPNQRPADHWVRAAFDRLGIRSATYRDSPPEMTYVHPGDPPGGGISKNVLRAIAAGADPAEFGFAPDGTRIGGGAGGAVQAPGGAPQPYGSGASSGGAALRVPLSSPPGYRVDDPMAHLNRMTAQDSDLMRAARTQGLQAANRRGLLNSSMAAEAVERAAYDAAIPLASQAAGQQFQKNRALQDYGFDSSLLSQDHTQQMARADQGYGHQRGLLTLQSDLDRGQAAQAHGFRLAELEQEAAAALERLGIQIGSEETIAGANIAAHDRQYAQAGLAAVDESYARMFTAIMSNPNIPADVRDKYMTTASQLRESGLALVQQMYGVHLDWAA